MGETSADPIPRVEKPSQVCFISAQHLLRAEIGLGRAKRRCRKPHLTSSTTQRSSPRGHTSAQLTRYRQDSHGSSHCRQAGRRTHLLSSQILLISDQYPACHTLAIARRVTDPSDSFSMAALTGGQEGAGARKLSERIPCLSTFLLGNGSLRVTPLSPLHPHPPRPLLILNFCSGPGQLKLQDKVCIQVATATSFSGQGVNDTLTPLLRSAPRGQSAVGSVLRFPAPVLPAEFTEALTRRD
ncbi:hypothetical protein AAFF_G00399510 [Aldrovandia affinis]|uniref:Uncharacterized protein n=1 Tax=Aldrovandia affinis TaxID=143900 RepID=A0AAD7WKI3_9TELE|nr:hypothetical protein AAFF_G00399510 [Aldrovandia affinis]